MQEYIKNTLTQKFDPFMLQVNIIDESKGKYDVLIISSSFEGISLVNRHKAVYACFKNELNSGRIHSLTIVTKTIKEYSK